MLDIFILTREVKIKRAKDEPAKRVYFIYSTFQKKKHMCICLLYIGVFSTNTVTRLAFSLVVSILHVHVDLRSDQTTAKPTYECCWIVAEAAQVELLAPVRINSISTTVHYRIGLIAMCRLWHRPPFLPRKDGGREQWHPKASVFGCRK